MLVLLRTYVPRPVTFLHRTDARVKQIMAFACLLIAARGTLETRFAMASVVVVVSLLCLPKQYSRTQLLGVLRLCLLVAFFALLASDSVNVPVQERLPDPRLSGLGEGSSFAPPSKYKYVLLNLGIFKVTRRSIKLAAAAASLQLATIQSAVICLTTTSPEELAEAFTWFLRPLKWLGINVVELGLSILLSFRFLGIILEEVQNICKGMLARSISWKDMQMVAKIDIVTTLLSKALKNMLSISDKVAQSMMTRGYDQSTFKYPHLYTKIDTDTDTDTDNSVHS